MKARVGTIVAALLLSLFSFGSIASADDEAPSLNLGDREWHFDLIPYFWAVGINGGLSMGKVDNRAPVDLNDVFQSVAPSGGLLFQSRYRAWTILYDFHFSKFKDTGDTTEGTITAELLQFMMELSASYRVPGIPFELILGGRFNYMQPSASIDGSEEVKETEMWFDPIIGARFVVNAEPVFVALRGDVGGFGLGSQITWGFNVLVGWQITDLFSISLAYRFMDWNYESGRSDELFTFDGQEYGITLGVGFHF